MCIAPIQLKDRTDSVPCGSCYECKRKRANGWAFRCSQQWKVSTQTFFITLTYDTDHVPITQKGFMSLRRKDLQLFFKKLRNTYRYKKVNTETGRKKWYYDRTPGLKYYAVGEYGTKTKRPHYHALLFLDKYDPLITKKIEQQWEHGSVHIGKLNEKTVNYTLKYISKTTNEGKAEWDDREVTKSLMSKGLGANYLTESIKRYHKQSLVERYFVRLDGYITSMPRYYRQKIYTKTQWEVLKKLITDESLRKEQDKIKKMSEKEKEIYLRNETQKELAKWRKQTRQNNKIAQGEKL